MAENKKSFVLYADQKDLFKKLPDEVAGKLIKHIYSYVNDENPTTDDLLIEVAFEPIKRQMKRDLEKWENIKTIRSENGKKGGRPKKENAEEAEIILENEKQTEAKKANGYLEKQTEAKKAVNVNVNVTDNVINKIKSGDKSPTPSSKLKETLQERKHEFGESLVPHVEIYGKEMIRKFFDYWTELNKPQTKMRWELEKVFETKKRLSTWSSRDSQFTNNNKKQEPTEIRVRKSEANGNND